MVSLNIGRARISVGKAPGENNESTGEAREALFTTRNFTLVATGVAIGVILRQQSEIRTLKRTIQLLQEVIR